MNYLSDRLKLIADNIEKGETMADIGTDHGFLPMYLLSEKISPKAIMADISSGSLAKARENFESFLENRGEGAVSGEPDFRLGSGLEVLENGEVDAVVMAGMGGRLIAELLQKDFEKTCSFRKFILQPRNGQGVLRHYLYQRGFSVSGEHLVDEEGRICNIIVAHPPEFSMAPADPFQGKPYWFKRYEPTPKEEYPAEILAFSPELGRRLFEARMAHYRDILKGIEIRGDGNSRKRMPVIKSKIDYLQSALEKYLQ